MRLARKTNKLGLTNYNLSEGLTRGQKSRLTVLEKGPFHDAIKYPNKFVRLDAPKSMLKNAKAAGALTTKTQLFVRNKYTAKGLRTFRNVRIENGFLMYEEKLNNVTLIKRVLYPGTKDFFKISKQLQDGTYPLGPNNQVTFKIGGNSPFNRPFTNYAELFNYVSDMQAGKVLRNTKNGKPIYNVDFGKVLPEISFVEIKRTQKKPKK